MQKVKINPIIVMCASVILVLSVLGNALTIGITYLWLHEKPKAVKGRITKPSRTHTNDRYMNIPPILVSTRGDAEMVVDQITDILNSYGQITVAEVYDLVGVPNTYLESLYGWRSNEGFIIMRDSYDIWNVCSSRRAARI